MKSTKIAIIALATMLFTSCAPRMAGTWNVQRFETSKAGEQGVSLNNIGTVHFNKNGTGEKNVNYTVLGVTHSDQNPFSWKWTDGKFVTIEGENSDFAKTWIIMTNKKKFQKWKSTDGSNQIQTLELKK